MANPEQNPIINLNSKFDVQYNTETKLYIVPKEQFKVTDAADPEVNWISQGECLGSDPGLFVAEPSENEKVEEAKKICLSCPVIDTCLEDALNNKKRTGVRGGTSERDRRKIKRDKTRKTAALALAAQEVTVDSLAELQSA